MKKNGPGAGKHSRSGDKSVTRGASVRSGLSAQVGFGDDSNASHALDNRGKNQVPIQNRESVSSDRGDFTCY